ncbi:DinB family protein [Caulobacter sp. NIBR2454]|uniref:DinB family protein n=1 Tax=Caulobacter sp. NIBR2454 TaxID=3015996 RepID=UPI0022B6B519|nr:DinB family protein [Caulobacter sp. NIBR2454]
MSLHEHCRMMAGYNGWANNRLFAACAKVPDVDYKAARGAFFGSLHGTLNHLLLTDRIWAARFVGRTAPSWTLDTILFEDFGALRVAREVEDGKLVDFVARLDDEQLAADFRWTRKADGMQIAQPLWAALAHLFNHQTHHRGQAHGLLTQMGVEAPSLDLVLYQRESGVGFRA